MSISVYPATTSPPSPTSKIKIEEKSCFTREKRKKQLFYWQNISLLQCDTYFSSNLNVRRKISHSFTHGKNK